MNRPSNMTPARHRGSALIFGGMKRAPSTGDQRGVRLVGVGGVHSQAQEIGEMKSSLPARRPEESPFLLARYVHNALVFRIRAGRWGIATQELIAMVIA
jgi:hypothetical protein